MALFYTLIPYYQFSYYSHHINQLAYFDKASHHTLLQYNKSILDLLHINVMLFDIQGNLLSIIEIGFKIGKWATKSVTTSVTCIKIAIQVDSTVSDNNQTLVFSC
ncbi:hypothetical protein CIHG_10052 [Coccidioides immitis H538.4]|uniref:Uncharacterized protein n=1 Tax=Coccidioides immitis H538.4 TaxID=396776 RepID=A0A0J8S7F6_COCIT|nr:hypothetical protein CIHG_10052 [Coccidioides immitis H538.4]